MSSTICEPLLQPDESRFVMFPVKYNDVWDLYKITIDCFRKAEDIDLSRDYDMHIDNARSWCIRLYTWKPTYLVGFVSTSEHKYVDKELRYLEPILLLLNALELLPMETIYVSYVLKRFRFDVLYL